jgi:hypothetical protein
MGTDEAARTLKGLTERRVILDGLFGDHRGRKRTRRFLPMTLLLHFTLFCDFLRSMVAPRTCSLTGDALTAELPMNKSPKRGHMIKSIRRRVPKTRRWEITS